MVVTRRAPAPPPQAAPRSDAAHNVVKVKSKPHEPTDMARKNTPDSTASDKKGGKGKKGKQKKTKKGRRTGPFSDLLAGVLFVWFTIYALSICPHDADLERPICKGLYEYRRLILEPFVIPPIQAALAHPSIAPHIERAKPHVDNFIAAAEPVAVRAQYEWNKRIVPQWNKRIVPQWNKRVVPQWRKHVVPELRRIEDKVQPYRQRAEHEYEQRLGPYVRLATYNLQRWQRAAQPYVILAANKTHQGYVKAKPYAIPVWNQFKVLVRRLLSILAAQRRQYVDPHVARIWEQIKESSTGKTGSPTKKTSSKASQAASSVVKSASSSSKSVASVASRSASSASSVASSSVAKASSSASSAVSSSASSMAKAASSAASSASSSVSSVVAPASSSVASVVDPIASSSSIAAPASSSASSVVASASSVVSSKASSIAPSASSVSSSISKAVTSTASSASSIASKATDSASSLASDASSNVSSSVSSAASAAPSVLSSASEAASSVASVVADTASDVASGVASSASSLASEASATAVAVIADAPVLVGGVADSAVKLGSSVSATASSVADEAVSSASSALTSESTTDAEEEIDADDFLADLGISDDLTTLEAEAEALEGMTETEEEKAARLQLEEEEKAAAKAKRQAETRAKRANIDRRHTSWEGQMQAVVTSKTKDLRRALVALRKTAAAELKASPQISGAVEELVSEAEKYLKGAESYLKNLKKEGRSDEEKATLWERVVQKVADKFTQKLAETEGVVNTWYMGVEQKEVEQVMLATKEVKDTAERAQADLGLDYVWLDDVTYSDWQRYHDLMRKSEAFADEAWLLQNGTHANAPSNAVLGVIGDLESEVDDVVKGFETRLRRIKRTGERAFHADVADETEEAAEPHVSILPAEPHNPAELADAPPPIAIGRSAEEVADAMARAGGTEPLPPKEEADVVGSIVEEASAEAEAAAETAPAHVEL